MKPKQSQQLKWERTRERFGIPDPFPPLPQRPEKRIGDILTEITKAAVVLRDPLPKELLACWSAVAGPQLAKHTCPAHIQDRILYVYADHPGWLSELKRLPKAHLLKRTLTTCPSAEIQDIRFQMDPALRTQKPSAFDRQKANPSN
jgi:hypothetical protein